MTTEQAARELGVGSAQVRYLIRVGILPATKVGRDWMIRPADVQRAKRRKRQGRGRKPGQ